AETDEVKTVSVMEGDSVTLNPDLTQIQGINLILWRFGDTGFTIAQVNENEISYDPDERFRDRLKLDHQTRSLTITNMRIKHSGLYKAEIIHNTGTAYSKFRVIVYESPAVIEAFKGETKSVSETEGESVTLQTDTETHGDELIAWRFGDEGRLIAKHDLEAKSPPLYDPDERFRDRLKLDHQTGSLTITNTRITDSGVYTVKISSSKQTLYKRFTVTVSAVPDSALSPGAVAGIVVGVVLLVLSAAAGVFYYRRKVSELQKETKKISKHLKQLPEMSKQLEQLTKTYENELTKISKEELLKISETLQEMSEISEKEMPKISEHLNQLRNKVTNQQTTRSDTDRGEEERCITVQETAISRATGDVKISTEEQSKKIPIRKKRSEDAGHIWSVESVTEIKHYYFLLFLAFLMDYYPTESQGNEPETVETPLLKKRDGENKPEDTTPG
ncbi:hypothetical protein ABG768_020647, partial [Culter alburnus]